MHRSSPATCPHTNARPRPAGHGHPLRGAPTRITKRQLAGFREGLGASGGRTPGSVSRYRLRHFDHARQIPGLLPTTAPRPPLHPSRQPLRCPRWSSLERMTAACWPRYGPNCTLITRLHCKLSTRLHCTLTTRLHCKLSTRPNCTLSTRRDWTPATRQ